MTFNILCKTSSYEVTEVEAAKAYDNYVIANDLFKLGYSTNFV